MKRTFTVLCWGRRIDRQFEPDEIVSAMLALLQRRDLLKPYGFTVLVEDGNVTHVVHRENAECL